ncbi:MAG: efflux RND transporter periplasmic adaptor subunit [Pseudomonadota bacterium]
MKKWLITVILFLVIIAGVVYYFHKRMATPPALTVAVTKGAITEKAEAIGYIKPRHSITIKSQVGGTVANIYHYEGEPIKKGEELIRITPAPDPSDYAAAYEALKEAQSNESHYDENLDRYHVALQQKLITKNYTDYLTAQQNKDVSILKRILAEQKLALLDEGKTQVAGKAIANVVASPIDGYILSRNVDIGDSVISLSSAQSATSLFTIANMNDLTFEGSVDEIDAAKIHTQMPATIIVGATPDKQITGTVERIALQSEQQAGTSTSDTPFNVSFQLQISNLKFPDNLNLRAGYSATADINLKTIDDALLLPARVVHFENNNPYVLLPADAGTEPKKKFITTGISDGINIEITKGLSLNQKVLDSSEKSDSDNS